jgi:hypothetical protein
MPAEKPVILNGTLEAFWEKAAIDTTWVFNEDGPKAHTYEAMHELKKGDFLRVFNDASKKEVIFEGKIDIIRRGSPFKWGHQKGQDPKAWSRMFYDAKPAELIIHVPRVRKPKAG